MMSVLYLQGLKQGDMQMTVNGLISTGLFFFLSQAKPLQKISAHRPSTSVFAYSVIISIAGQFVVHFVSLLATLYLSQQYSIGHLKHVSVDGKFQPDLVNSSVYILCTLMQINNFVMNYRGHPFTQSIQENDLMWRSVQVLYVLLLIIVGGQLEPLNDFLQLAPFPSSDYQMYLIALLVTNTAAIYGVEKFSLLYE